MSMLAEKKRKIKWTLLPKRAPEKPLWMTETEGLKFGQKLMEKMGWSAGKGLGAKEQGIQEPLRVSYKNDTKGMGYKLHDDEWIEQQDEFNDLLSQLSSTVDGSTKDLSIDSQNEKSEIKSLEEKSKKSKSRVHYKKFTRGKDLSRYSENDLACILGVNKLKPDKKCSEVKPMNEINNESKMDDEQTFGVKTIHGGSLVDYFTSKWAELKQGGKKLPPQFSSSIQNKGDEKFEFNNISDNTEMKVGRKRKHSLDVGGEVLVEKNDEKVNNSTDFNENMESASDENVLKKKRKKAKSEKKETMTNGDDDDDASGIKNDEIMENNDNDDNDVEKSEISKKKKKKKKQKDKIMKEVEIFREDSEIIDEECDNIKKKKKDKGRKKESCVEVADNTCVDVTNCNKEKSKKRKKKDEVIEKEEQSTVDTQKENEHTKKHKNSKEKMEDVSSLTNDHIKGDSDVSNVIHTHKVALLKKKKIKIPENITNTRALKLYCGAEVDRFKGSNLAELEGYGNLLKRTEMPKTDITTS